VQHVDAARRYDEGAVPGPQNAARIGEIGELALPQLAGQAGDRLPPSCLETACAEDGSVLEQRCQRLPVADDESVLEQRLELLGCLRS